MARVEKWSQKWMDKYKDTYIEFLFETVKVHMVVQTEVFLKTPNGGAYFVGETIFDVVENLRGSAVRRDFLSHTLEGVVKMLLDVVIYQVKEGINIKLTKEYLQG